MEEVNEEADKFIKAQIREDAKISVNEAKNNVKRAEERRDRLETKFIEETNEAQREILKRLFEDAQEDLKKKEDRYYSLVDRFLQAGSLFFLVLFCVHLNCCHFLLSFLIIIVILSNVI